MNGETVERFAGSALSRAEAAARQWPSPQRPMFVSAGAYSARRLQHAAPHRYAVWKLAYYRSGAIDALVDGVSYPITAGTVLVVPPHADHAEVAHTAYSNYFVLVNARPDWPWPLITTDDGANRLGGVFAALVREKSAPDEHALAMVDALVQQVDIALRRDHARRHDSAARTIVNAVDQLLEERYAEQVRLDAVARDVGVSGSTLRAYFAAELGMSPQARLLEIRLRHAVALLRTSDLTLASVAERCGYHSASHLSRHVKAALSSTPGEIRRRGHLLP
ncbi:helix-turn-helix transcriptional regulator [Jiangella alkaliphila]|uniref:Helix-turn-helix domain-containing protein n=1 Tax=Jiangella alkaliphila TaxID=419479 RepID=A0A1H2JRN0_9ACTN|nr:AraC family transcriptional regulator [Jiangella alkaliphila]SDU59204.1 Helix-turn-helix domain-containing protein [Jiangella alkaliphila]